MILRHQGNIGWFVVQDHWPEWSGKPGQRAALYGTRLTGRTGLRDVVPVIQQGGTGDFVCARLWEPARRQIPAYSWAMPAVVAGAERRAVTRSPGPGTAGPVGAVPTGLRPVTPSAGPGAPTASLLPIRRDDYEPDQRFRASRDRLPEWSSTYPAGTLGLGMAGVEEGAQEDLFLPTDSRIIAPEQRGAPRDGTLIVGTDPDGVLRTPDPGSPPDHHSGYQAHFQALAVPIRVGPGIQHLPIDKERNAVALQFAASHQGQLAGLGAAICLAPRPQDGQTEDGPPPPVVTPRTGSPGPQPDTAAAEAAGNPRDPSGPSGAVEGSTASVGGYLEPRIVAVLAAEGGYGPIHPGDPKEDKHRLGDDRDGTRWNSGHLATRSYWWHDRDHDGPLEFQPHLTYPHPPPLPFVARTHISWDPDKAHEWFSAQRGVFRVYSEELFTLTGDPPWRPPPDRTNGPRTPTPGTPPPTEPQPPGGGTPPYPGDPIPPPPPPAVTPPPSSPNPGDLFPGGGVSGARPGAAGGGSAPSAGDSGGSGGTTGHTGEGGGSPAGGGPSPHRPPPGGADPIDPDRPLPPVPPFAGPGDPMPYRPWPPPVKPWTGTEGVYRPNTSEILRQRGLGTRQTDRHAFTALETGGPSHVWRPQNLCPGVADLRRSNSPGTDALLIDNRYRPASARTESWAQQDGARWSYVEHPQHSRHVGGTAHGGVAFIPAETDVLDVLRYAPYRPVVSRTYFHVAGGAYWGAGDVDLADGDLAPLAWRWREGDDSASLTFESRSNTDWHRRVRFIPAAGGGAVEVWDGGAWVPIVDDSASATGRLRAVYVRTSGTGATHTPASGTTLLRIVAVGAGGGGGGADGANNQAGAGGGGAAGAVVTRFAAAAVLTYTVTASGGAGGTAGNNPGTAGGDTTVTGTGISITAKGGGGGGSMAAGTSHVGSAGGVPQGGTTGGDVDVPGGGGAAGVRLSGSLSFGGGGGSGPYGHGGAGGVQAVGVAATGYGAGGGGAGTVGNTDRAGGDGSPGLLIIEEYY